MYLEQVGLRPILVHGGGKSISRAMEESGLELRWHEGRRITDAATMAIVEREVERLNNQLVDHIFELVSCCWTDAKSPLVRGTVLDPVLELVGTPTSVDVDFIIRYGTRGLIPVVPPLSIGQDKAVMNTNDDIALAVAKGLSAAKLLFCSNIPGVMRDPGDPSTRIASLTPDEVRLRDEGVISGGMIPAGKLFGGFAAWSAENTHC